MKEVVPPSEPLEVGPILTHRWHFDPGHRHSGKHQFHHALLVTHQGVGSMTHRGKNDVYTCDSSHLFIIPPEVDQEWTIPRESGRWEPSYCLFIRRPAVAEILEGLMAGTNITHFTLHTHRCRKRIFQIMAQMVALTKSQISCREKLQYSLLEQLLLWLTEDQEVEKRGFDPRVLHAIEWIDEHLGEPIPLAELARHCGSSRTQLSVVFRDQMGCTPGQYWESQRVSKAMDLLKNSHLSIEQIAYSLGYSDAPHFSRRFKVLTGKNPSSFRGTKLFR